MGEVQYWDYILRRENVHEVTTARDVGHIKKMVCLPTMKVKCLLYKTGKEKHTHAHTEKRGRRNLPQCHYFNYSNFLGYFFCVFSTYLKSRLTSYYIQFYTLCFSFTIMVVFPMYKKHFLK